MKNYETPQRMWRDITAVVGEPHFSDLWYAILDRKFYSKIEIESKSNLTCLPSAYIRVVAMNIFGPLSNS